ncbi:MAG: outer membrane protein assembly factor BamD [candidate division WOR-3 bacterium]
MSRANGFRERGAWVPAMVMWVAAQVGVVVGSCAAKHTTSGPAPNTAQGWFELGLERLNRGQYGGAISAFQRVTLDYASTHYAADAQFYLAKAYADKKDYDQAITEYEFFMTNYPRSAYFEEASYQIALCYVRRAPRSDLDQADLKTARELLELFRERFPESRLLAGASELESEIAGRLARKEFASAKLYMKAGEFAAARVYLEHMLDEYPRLSFRDEARLCLAICLENMGEQEKARSSYHELELTASDERVRKEAAGRLRLLR